MKKIGKKVQAKDLKKYKVHFGTMDRRTSDTLYVSISSWAKPKINTTIDYDKVLRKLNKKIKDYIYTNLNKEYFNNKFIIVDLDLRTSGIRYDKKSFMCCEFTLYKNTDESIDSDGIVTEVNKLIGNLTKDVLDKSEHFSFTKTKK
jgi:hypothetical protein